MSALCGTLTSVLRTSQWTDGRRNLLLSMSFILTSHSNILNFKNDKPLPLLAKGCCWQRHFSNNIIFYSILAHTLVFDCHNEKQAFVPKVPFLTNHLPKWKNSNPSSRKPSRMHRANQFYVTQMLLRWQGKQILQFSHTISIPIFNPFTPQLCLHWAIVMWLSLTSGM